MKVLAALVCWAVWANPTTAFYRSDKTTAPSFTTGTKALASRGGFRKKQAPVVNEGMDPTTTAAVGAGVGIVAVSVLAQKIAARSTYIAHSDNGNQPNGPVFFKTLLSVIITSAGLWALLYGANIPAVTEFYCDLGVWYEVYGLAPILYVAFWFLTFAASFATELLCGTVSAASRQQMRPTETPSAEWYTSIRKPSWNPPGWVFPTMWLLICKPTQFLALREVFLQSVYKTSADAATAVLTSKPNWKILALYTTHLALGNAWNDVFFGYEKVGLGLLVILAFWATLGGTAYLFYKEVTPRAGYLMLPTVLWVTIATALNGSIYNLNKDEEAKINKSRRN